MKIAVLSDTHGLLRPQVKAVLADCDAAIHAGDITSQKILNELVHILGEGKPFYVVHGNNDRAWSEEELPLTKEFELDNVSFFLVHNRNDVPSNLGSVQVVIFGHSHRYFEERIEGRLWLNPGSCGKQRFHKDVTMAILDLEDGKMHVERLDFERYGTGNDVAKTDQNHTQNAEKERRSITEGKMVEIVEEIFSRMDKGQTIVYIAGKVGLEESLVEQICRIRVTHPGVTPGGVVDKMEVNRIIVKSSR